MGFFSKGKTTTDTNNSFTQTTRADPFFQQQAEAFNAQAQQTAENFNPLVLPGLPGFNQDQINAQDAGRTLATSGSTLGGISDSLAGIRGIGGSSIDPGQFSVSGGGVSAGQATASLADRGDIRDVSSDPAIAAQFSGEDLRRILGELDPSFTDDVINRTQLANERQRQIQQIADSDAAIAAGAFGGSREGVARSLTNEAFDRNDLDIAARLNMQRFNTGIGIQQSDLERMQQASLFSADQSLRAAQSNQGVDFGVASQNAALGTNTSIANAGNQTQASIASGQIGVQGKIASMQAALQASLANQNNNFRTQAFNQGLNLDVIDRQTGINSIERNRSLQDIELLNAIGGQNRGLELDQRNVGIQNDFNAQQAPLTQLDILRMGLSGLPTNPTVSGSGTGFSTQEKFGSPLSVLGGALEIGGKLFGVGGFGG